METHEFVRLIGYNRSGLSERDRDTAERAFRDTVAVILAGWSLPTVTHVRTVVDGSPPRAPQRAFLLGVAAHMLDFDDSHFESLAHPSAVLVPAILGSANVDGATRSLQQGWEAYSVGLRTNFLVGGLTSRAQYYDHGFHTTASLGVLGAAAASSHLLGLDPSQMISAVAIAGTFAGGLRGAFGTPLKPIQVGRAAEGGVTAALLAASGVEATIDPVIGEAGYIAAYANAELAGRLGEYAADLEVDAHGRVVVPLPSIKRFPSCGATHASIQAALKLRERLGARFDVDSIEAVHVDQSAASDVVLHCRTPRTPQEAQFSLSYCVATALVNGEVTLGDFEQEHLDSMPPRVARVLQTVEARVSTPYSRIAEQESRFPARVTLRLAGRLEEQEVLETPGGTQDPLTFEELREKYESCVPKGWTSSKAERVWALLGDATAALCDLDVLAMLE